MATQENKFDMQDFFLRSTQQQSFPQGNHNNTPTSENTNGSPGNMNSNTNDDMNTNTNNRLTTSPPPLNSTGGTPRENGAPHITGHTMQQVPVSNTLASLRNSTNSAATEQGSSSPMLPMNHPAMSFSYPAQNANFQTMPLFHPSQMQFFPPPMQEQLQQQLFQMSLNNNGQQQTGMFMQNNTNPNANNQFQQNKIQYNSNQQNKNHQKNRDPHRKRRKHQWEVYELEDYLEELLLLMPRTLYSKSRERNSEESSWYTYDVRAGMYIVEKDVRAYAPNCVPIQPREEDREDFYARYNPNYRPQNRDNGFPLRHRYKKNMNFSHNNQHQRMNMRPRDNKFRPISSNPPPTFGGNNHHMPSMNENMHLQATPQKRNRKNKRKKRKNDGNDRRNNQNKQTDEVHDNQNIEHNHNNKNEKQEREDHGTEHPRMDNATETTV